MSICMDGSGKHCQCQPDDATQPDISRYCPNPIVRRVMKWYEEERIPNLIKEMQITTHEG
jgi:hypothetical protein